MRLAEKKRVAENLIYGAAALLVFALLWLATFQERGRDRERTNYDIVFLGDSLIGQCRDETSVTEQLSELLGQPVFNGAMGGTCMAMRKGAVEEDYGKELLNMVSLAKAIAADDFGAQQTVRSRQAVTDYFADNIDELECIDFSSVKTLVLVYGVNDYHAAIPIENEDNLEDATTFSGAVRMAVNTLKKAYPDMRVLLVTPTYTWYKEEGLTCEQYDTGRGCLEKYVDAQIRTARELGVETVDLYHAAYTHDVWEDWMVYTEDGLHPNENGRHIIAEILAGYLQDVA